MIKKPLFKIVKKKHLEYAEILLRCHADEHQDARKKIEEYGTIKRATDAIFTMIEEPKQDLSVIIEEIKFQHEQQLQALKSHLKEHFSSIVASEMLMSGNESGADKIIDDAWSKIER